MNLVYGPGTPTTHGGAIETPVFVDVTDHSGGHYIANNNARITRLPSGEVALILDSSDPSVEMMAQFAGV